MRKILLVGNGLTSQLIPGFTNEQIMARLQALTPVALQKAEKFFGPLRYPVKAVQYVSVAAGYCGTLSCGETGLSRPISGLPYNPNLIDVIKYQLQAQGFDDVDDIVTTYFQTYGLIYETQRNCISNIESVIKIIDLYSRIGHFTQQDKAAVEQVANIVCYNDGNIGAESLPNSIRRNLRQWLTGYDAVFTTNYDNLLDDILENTEIRHIHGGFYYAGKYQHTKELQPPEKAFLIWGISGTDKREKMAGEFTFPIEFPFEIPESIFSEYLSELRKITVERIDIFGYSGENDQHINRAMADNSNIREVHYFCAPDKINDGIEEYRIRARFFVDHPKKLILEPWNTIWDKIKVSREPH